MKDGITTPTEPWRKFDPETGRSVMVVGIHDEDQGDLTLRDPDDLETGQFVCDACGKILIGVYEDRAHRDSFLAWARWAWDDQVHVEVAQ